MKTSPPTESSVEELKFAIGLLVRRMRSASPSGLHDLSWTQRATMAHLADVSAATTADLARAQGVKPQSMRTALVTLEDMGLIERKSHPTDGRQINIQLTKKGAMMRKDSKDASRAWLTTAIGGLNQQEQALLFAAGQVIKRLAESQ